MSSRQHHCVQTKAPGRTTEPADHRFCDLGLVPLARCGAPSTTTQRSGSERGKGEIALADPDQEVVTQVLETVVVCTLRPPSCDLDGQVEQGSADQVSTPRAANAATGISSADRSLFRNPGTQASTR